MVKTNVVMSIFLLRAPLTLNTAVDSVRVIAASMLASSISVWHGSCRYVLWTSFFLKLYIITNRDWLQMGNRSGIRARYQIDGSGCGDCLTACCCTPCELTQGSRELELEEKSLGGPYGGMMRAG
jgi:Cys-rich protein (TIGR01571 family)